MRSSTGELPRVSSTGNTFFFLLLFFDFPSLRSLASDLTQIRLVFVDVAGSIKLPQKEIAVDRVTAVRFLLPQLS